MDNHQGGKEQDDKAARYAFALFVQVERPRRLRVQAVDGYGDGQQAIDELDKGDDAAGAEGISTAPCHIMPQPIEDVVPECYPGGLARTVVPGVWPVSLFSFSHYESMKYKYMLLKDIMLNFHGIIVWALDSLRESRIIVS